MKRSTPSGPLDPLSNLRRRRDVRLRQIGLDVALFDPATDRVHMLNPVAAAVWQHVTPDRTFLNVVEALELSFPHEKPSAIAGHVRALIGKLRTLKLLVPSGTKAPKAKPRKELHLPLPDRAIGPLEHGYQRPTVRTFTMAQLEKIYDVDVGRIKGFADIWSPQA